MLLCTVSCYQGVPQPADDAGISATGASANPGDDDGDSSDTGEGAGELACPPATSSERATLRRLTRAEYNNTIRDLLGDESLPANAFPSEQAGNDFGNAAEAQPTSLLLVEQYSLAAAAIARRATESPLRLAQLASCAADIDESTPAAVEEACRESVIEHFLPRAYRRPLRAGELDELSQLTADLRQYSDFAGSIAGLIETVLQAPDFLYRMEVGFVDDAGDLRPTPYEMATRLSYLYWGTMPDAQLFASAEAGELVTAPSVLRHAERMLADDRARPMIRFYFDNVLPLSDLAAMQRDETLYPTYTPAIGALMREETHRLLEYEIFEGPGTWDHALTAPYTFVNGPLAEFYGWPGVSGDEFVKVDLDTKRRLGVLTHAGVVAGMLGGNETNPVARGIFVVRKLMCQDVPAPPDALVEEVRPPEPDSGATARERYARHSSDPQCAGCHTLMDPIGLTLENYDAVGRWRDSENGVTIDPSGAVPGVGEVAGPIELVQTLAATEAVHRCFARKWFEYAHGRSANSEDACTLDDLDERFSGSDHDIRQLLLDLVQTDEFLYLPQKEG